MVDRRATHETPVALKTALPTQASKAARQRKTNTVLAGDAWLIWKRLSFDGHENRKSFQNGSILVAPQVTSVEFSLLFAVDIIPRRNESGKTKLCNAVCVTERKIHASPRGAIVDSLRAGGCAAREPAAVGKMDDRRGIGGGEEKGETEGETGGEGGRRAAVHGVSPTRVPLGGPARKKFSTVKCSTIMFSNRHEPYATAIG